MRSIIFEKDLKKKGCLLSTERAQIPQCRDLQGQNMWCITVNR